MIILGFLHFYSSISFSDFTNMADYERVCLILKEVFVYKIPPRSSNQAVRATDWGLSNPSFTGRMKVTSLKQEMFIKIEDQVTGNLFAQAVVKEMPTKAIEPVSDSSRYSKTGENVKKNVIL